MVTVRDRGLETLRGLRNCIRSGYSDRIEPLRAGEFLDQAAELVGSQKSSFA